MGNGIEVLAFLSLTFFWHNNCPSLREGHVSAFIQGIHEESHRAQQYQCFNVMSAAFHYIIMVIFDIFKRQEVVVVIVVLCSLGYQRRCPQEKMHN